jgi:hypothetical protein
MNHEITKSFDDLLRETHSTAITYFGYAERILTESERDFTTADIIALAAVMANDFHSASNLIAAQTIKEGFLNLEKALSDISNKLENMNFGA